MKFPAEEIRGFDSPLAYRAFGQDLDKCVQAGTATEEEPKKNYVAGDIVGGRWFKDTGTGRIWRLVAPVNDFAGVWEEVFVS